jgi:hypothetical protein
MRNLGFRSAARDGTFVVHELDLASLEPPRAR